MQVARAIALEATLSFLGLGVQEPLTSWGALISEGAGTMSYGTLWQLAFPLFFFVITLFILCFISRYGSFDGYFGRSRGNICFITLSAIQVTLHMEATTEEQRPHSMVQVNMIPFRNFSWHIVHAGTQEHIRVLLDIRQYTFMVVCLGFRTTNFVFDICSLKFM